MLLFKEQKYIYYSVIVDESLPSPEMMTRAEYFCKSSDFTNSVTWPYFSAKHNQILKMEYKPTDKKVETNNMLKDQTQVREY